MRTLIQIGANLDAHVLEEGRTCLMDAAMRGDLKTFTFLLRSGASKDERDHIGRHLNDYIKMDYAGKTSTAKSEINSIMYKQVLYQVG